MGKDDFGIRPGRIRSTRAPRTKSFLTQALKSAESGGPSESPRQERRRVRTRSRDEASCNTAPPASRSQRHCQGACGPPDAVARRRSPPSDGSDSTRYWPAKRQRVWWIFDRKGLAGAIRCGKSRRSRGWAWPRQQGPRVRSCPMTRSSGYVGSASAVSCLPFSMAGVGPMAAEMCTCSKSPAIWCTPAVALTRSGRQSLTRSGPHMPARELRRLCIHACIFAIASRKGGISSATTT